MRYVILLMGLYLALMAGLAVKYDWQFFVNDAIAIVVFTVLLIGLIAYELPRWRQL